MTCILQEPKPFNGKFMGPSKNYVDYGKAYIVAA
jgi:hypothetical protein